MNSSAGGEGSRLRSVLRKGVAGNGSGGKDSPPLILFGFPGGGNDLVLQVCPPDLGETARDHRSTSRAAFDTFGQDTGNVLGANGDDCEVDFFRDLSDALIDGLSVIRAAARIHREYTDRIAEIVLVEDHVCRVTVIAE